MAEATIDVDFVAGQNKANEELQFHDIPHEFSDERTDAKGKLQTHTFTDFPHTAGSDDEDSDKSELLKEETKPPSFWTFDYYMQFFDVDTHQVLRRIVGSMLPRPRKNYLKSQIRPNPDLYGPFWICTTLVFTTAIAGNLSNYLQFAGKDSQGNSYQWKYDFHKVTFSASAIFGYWWLIPSMLFGFLWWRGNQVGYSFLEILCVYGYSLAIYIPISILWVVQINWFQWILVIIGALLSGSVLLLTFWPAVREDAARLAWAVMAVLLLLHALLAVGFVLYFFHVPSTISPASQNVTQSSSQSPQVTMQSIISGTKAPLQSPDKQKEVPTDAGGGTNNVFKKGGNVMNKESISKKETETPLKPLLNPTEKQSGKKQRANKRTVKDKNSRESQLRQG